MYEGPAAPPHPRKYWVPPFPRSRMSTSFKLYHSLSEVKDWHTFWFVFTLSQDSNVLLFLYIEVRRKQLVLRHSKCHAISAIFVASRSDVRFCALVLLLPRTRSLSYERWRGGSKKDYRAITWRIKIEKFLIFQRRDDQPNVLKQDFLWI